MGRDQVTLSRPIGSHLGGKQTQPVKTLVSDEFKDEITAFWRSKGYASESDFVREALIVAVHGHQFLTDLHRARIESLARSGSEIGTEAGR